MTQTEALTNLRNAILLCQQVGIDIGVTPMYQVRKPSTAIIINGVVVEDDRLEIAKEAQK